MNEFILLIKNYSIDRVLKMRGAFKQEAIKRGKGFTSAKKGDLVHIFTANNRKVKYTCTVVDINKKYAILAWYDEYKIGIDESYLIKTHRLQKGSHKNWDYNKFEGLYKEIEHKGTRRLKS